MTAIDWAALSRLVPEAVMVVIVLAYQWQQGKRQDVREQRHDSKDERRDKAFIQAMAERDKEWREFMGVERTRQAEGVAMLTHEITNLSALVVATNQLLTMHDKWEREELDRRLPMKPKTGPFHPHEAE